MLKKNNVCVGLACVSKHCVCLKIWLSILGDALMGTLHYLSTSRSISSPHVLLMIQQTCTVQTPPTVKK